MNYRLIQYLANKFPSYIREDIFQDGCVAQLSGKQVHSYMIDRFRWWTHYRRCQPDMPWEYEEIDKIADFEPMDLIEAITQKEQMTQLRPMLRKLKPRWLEILQMRFWDGFSMKEIGQITGTSESNISRLNSKILKKLRTSLKVPVSFG